MNAIDIIDLKILAALQDNARLSNHELAARVGLSASPCWRRVRRLERDGVIGKYVALLDAARVGLHLTAYAHVLLENHHVETVEQFDDMIRALPAVQECYSTSGEYDYLLRIAVSSMAEYERVLSRHILQSRAVRQVSTGFVLKQKKYTTALPLPADPA